MSGIFAILSVRSAMQEKWYDDAVFCCKSKNTVAEVAENAGLHSGRDKPSINQSTFKLRKLQLVLLFSPFRYCPLSGIH